MVIAIEICHPHKRIEKLMVAPNSRDLLAGSVVHIEFLCF